MKRTGADGRSNPDEPMPISRAMRNVPVIALIDTASADVRDMIYDAGADFVVAWENLENRIGDIAGLAVDNWLNTDPFEDEELQTG